jgi:hypothetical protein
MVRAGLAFLVLCLGLGACARHQEAAPAGETEVRDDVEPATAGVAAPEATDSMVEPDGVDAESVATGEIPPVGS